MNKLTGPGSIFDRHSIRFPILRLTVTAVLFGIGLALLSDALLMLDNVRHDIRRSLTSAANAAGAAASAAVVFDDARAAQDVLRMLEAYPEIRAAALYTGSGQRLATYGDTRLLPRTAESVSLAQPEIPPLGDVATVAVPVVVDDVAVGIAYLHAKLDTYWRTYISTMAATLFVGLSAGALALLLAMRFLDRIILPVRLLAEVARDARLRQDFRPRPIPAAEGEVGDMVSNFNALLEEVDASRQSLQSYQGQLERLVLERTAELSQAKETAEQANLAKSRFLAAASHDLRQPIQAMRLFQDALGRTPLNDEQRRIVEYLAQSTRSLAEILNVLLDVSKLDGGTVQPRPEMVPVRSLLANMEAEFAPLALAKGLRFKLFFPDRALTLFTDAKLLHSLLRNLIDNALKYTPRGGILVGVRRRGSRILIQVWDTGIGVAPEHTHAIFDEYFQVSNPQRDSTKGLGLGLAIVKRVAGLLDGRVSCRSRPGRGSVFELDLPLSAASETPPLETRATAVATSPLGGLRVVVVEDDLMAARATDVSLTACGMEVMAFRCAEDALADPSIESADFFIADFRLPGINGAEFLDAVQGRLRRQIKAMLLTGETLQAEPGSSYFGGWKVFVKPVELTAMIAEIQSQLSLAPV